MVEKICDLNTDLKICKTCARKVKIHVSVSNDEATLVLPSTSTNLPRNNSDSTNSSADLPEMMCIDNDFEIPQATTPINSLLETLNESPVKAKRFKEPNYAVTKCAKVSSVIKEKVFLLKNNTDGDDENVGEIIINQLKEVFDDPSTSQSKKIQILTLVPKNWNLRKAESLFDASYRQALTAKKLVTEQGILAVPNPRPGKRLSENTVKLVLDFYNRDDVSRVYPGKRDVVTIKINGEKTIFQKRLILANLKEIYKLFKDEHPSAKVGLSKFMDLRPKYCLLAGDPGTHSVCVCTTHQNMKLMLEGCHIKQLTQNDAVNIETSKDCISKIICNPSQPQCYFLECANCPGADNLKKMFDDIFELNSIDNITYKKWTTTHRSQLETIVDKSSEFVEKLIENLKKLLLHSFYATEQNAFFNNLKNSLKEGECVVICDFSENYAFVCQDAVQGFHWNNDQATIHPFVIYYRNSDTNAIDHTSLVIISDCLKHDTVAVHLFQEALINYLTR
jgi:hypothetical protein